MKYSTGVSKTARDLIESALTGNLPFEEKLAFLGGLEEADVESYLTEEGDLWVRYWQIGGRGFADRGEAAVIRQSRSVPGRANELDWLSRNLDSVREQYDGQWIAISGNEVSVSASSLSELMNQITELDQPFITFISPEPVVWSFTYANKRL